MVAIAVERFIGNQHFANRFVFVVLEHSMGQLEAPVGDARENTELVENPQAIWSENDA